MFDIKQYLASIIFIIVVIFSLNSIALVESEDNLSLGNYQDSSYSSNHKTIQDPLESLNRKIFSFNNILNKSLISPVSHIYNFVIPEWGRDRIESFTNNLNNPLYMINNLLQKDVEAAFGSFWRFIINAGFGIGGLFDMATIVGLKESKTDFGATLAKYNVASGPYLILPVLGSSSVRDFSANIIDYCYLDIFNYKINNHRLSKGTKIARTSLYYTSLRAKYVDVIEDTEKHSLDPYVTFKSLYTQIRVLKK